MTRTGNGRSAAAAGTNGIGRPAWAGRRLLAVFPHPDDESYAAAGLLAHGVHRGAAVALVCATRGERGTDWRGIVASGAALAALRTAELTAACAALGVPPPRFCDLPDGGLATVDPGAALAALHAEFERARPHVVVTLGADGAYGHPDHLALTALVERAVRALPPARAPRLLHCAFPRRLFAPVWHLAQRAGVPPGVPLEALGVERTAAHLHLDVRAVRAAKLAALAAHASQLDVRRGSFLRRLVRPLLAEEWYLVAYGPPLPPGATDPFAGL